MPDYIIPSTAVCEGDLPSAFHGNHSVLMPHKVQLQLNWQDLGQLLWLVRKVNGFGKLLKSGNFGKMVD